MNIYVDMNFLFMMMIMMMMIMNNDYENEKKNLKRWNSYCACGMYLKKTF